MRPPSSSDAADTGYAPASWEFDEEVSRVFDDMLERSIPQYETMRESVTLVASAFLGRSGCSVIDLGCSRGDALASIAALPATSDVEFVGVELSPPMASAARERFADDPRVEIVERDLRDGLKEISPGPACVVLSVLTLMFVPVNYRPRLLAEARSLLRTGGALVLVEKTLGEGPAVDDVFNANYHAKKVRSGYSPEDVERKRLSLEGVLVPLPASTTEDWLRRAGFREIDTFWAWMNFRGWVAVA